VAILRMTIVALAAATIRIAAAPQLPEAADPKPSFEVASVKQNTSAAPQASLRIDPGGYLRATAAPVFWLIGGAYGDAKGALRPEQVVGAPSWLRSERYDIAAKVPDAYASGEASPFITMRPFIQSLLEERFYLRTHRESRELPIYALVRARNGRLGPGLSRSTVDCSKDETKCGFGGGAAGRIKVEALTSDLLMQLLANASGRIVIDRTGLEGPFAIDLEWSQDQSVSDRPSIFTAVQEQLGLKLESMREPVNVLVIDHVERPSPD